MRNGWGELPDGVRVAVQRRTGPVQGVRPASGGSNADLTATLYTARGKTFLKAARKLAEEDGRELRSLRREAAIGHVLPTACTSTLREAMTALAWFWALNGMVGEGRHWLDRLLEARDTTGRGWSPLLTMATLNMEVAALVAEGMSNREIAERLTIAKRTADSHVEHILGKFGCSSRAQIAVWIATQTTEP